MESGQRFAAGFFVLRRFQCQLTRKEMIVDKLAISEIMLLLREKSLTSREISEALGLHSTDIARHLSNSVRQGLVRIDENQKVLLPPKMKEQARA